MSVDVPATGDLAALEAERDFLLRSITDLDAERAAGDIDEADYQTLKDGYTARAAAVLAVIDGLGSSPASPVAAPSAPAGRRWRAPAVIGAVAVFGIAAGLLLSHNAGTRLPGQTSSGNAQTATSAKLIAQAEKDTSQGQYLNAVKAYDQVLKSDPHNVQALAEEGWVLRIVGQAANNTALVDRGLSDILEAESTDPSYAMSYFFGGETYLGSKHDPGKAITQFEQFLGSNPPPALASFVQGELRTAQAALPPGASGAASAPSGAGSAPSGAASAPSGAASAPATTTGP